MSSDSGETGSGVRNSHALFQLHSTPAASWGARTYPTLAPLATKHHWPLSYRPIRPWWQGKQVRLRSVDGRTASVGGRECVRREARATGVADHCPPVALLPRPLLLSPFRTAH